MARDKKASQKQKSVKAAAAVKAEPKRQKAKQGAYDSLKDPLDRELALLGLRVKQITADGNCFFRALSDQLEGDEHQHSSLRARVVGLMQCREEQFAPFVEDDQSFTAYTARMKKEGTWAGHMELQAASLLLEANIAVYQAGQPRWSITNFPPGSRLLHLSYHDGEHYNSVRRAGYYSPGPPQPITQLAAVAHAGELQSKWSAADEGRVAAGTGCDNPALIQQQLAAADGDVNAAIEAVIEILAAEEEAGSTAGAGEAAAAAAAAVPPTDQPSAVSSSEGVVGVVGDEQHQAATAGKSAAKLSEAAIDVVTQSTPADGQQDNETDAAAAAAPPAVALVTAYAEAVDGTSTDGQSAEASTAAGECASSRQDAPQTAAQPTSVAGSSAGSSKGVKLKGGSKLKHAKAGAAGADIDKRPSRNKPCPCGSGRKHKNCCESNSSGSGKTSSQEQQAGVGLPVQLATLHI